MDPLKKSQKKAKALTVLVGGPTREGESPGLGHVVDPEDSSEGSSVGAVALEERGGRDEDEDEDEDESLALGQEDKSELEDPDEYGERLVDGGGQEVTGEAGVVSHLTLFFFFLSLRFEPRS